MSRPLGKTQQEVLKTLRDLGPWPGQWIWGNYSTTVRLLESLVRRGLVEKVRMSRTVQGKGIEWQDSWTEYRIKP